MRWKLIVHHKRGHATAHFPTEQEARKAVSVVTSHKYEWIDLHGTNGTISLRTADITHVEAVPE